MTKCVKWAVSVRTEKNAVLGILITWLIILLLSVPVLFKHGEVKYAYQSENRSACNFIQDDDHDNGKMIFHVSGTPSPLRMGAPAIGNACPSLAGDLLLDVLRDPPRPHLRTLPEDADPAVVGCGPRRARFRRGQTRQEARHENGRHSCGHLCLLLVSNTSKWLEHTSVPAPY